MANAAPGGTAPVRPATVNTAVYLLYLLTVLLVLGFITGLAVYDDYRAGYREGFAGSSAEDQSDAWAAITVYGVGVIGMLFAVGFAILARFNGRGSNPARIVTWVLAGIFLCCLGSSFASGFTSGVGGGGNADAPDPDQISRALEDNLPGWYSSGSLVLNIITLLACLGVIILLALPASNAFFRKRPAEPTWEPPLPPPTP